MTPATPLDRLAARGLALPPPPSPAGSYVPARREGRVITTSSISAKHGATLRYLGQVGGDLSVDEGRRSASDATLNCLSVIHQLAGSLNRVESVVRVVGYVSSAPGFVDQHKVMDAASELLLDVFGDAGAHTRAALGVAALPANCSVGVELTAVLKPDPDPEASGREAA